MSASVSFFSYAWLKFNLKLKNLFMKKKKTEHLLNHFVKSYFYSFASQRGFHSFNNNYSQPLV